MSEPSNNHFAPKSKGSSTPIHSNKAHQTVKFLSRRGLLWLYLLSHVTFHAPSHAGIPEPEVVFYGSVTRSSGSGVYVPGEVAWTVSGNAETLAVSQSTLVVVNDQAFYVTRVPFETRRLADNTALPATPNTLALTAAATTYTRTARVDGTGATLPTNAGTFNHGAAIQGLVERVDLLIGETFAEWSQRIFGALVGQTADADGDGASNHDEYLAGTDPRHPSSRLRTTGFSPNANGSVFTLTWETAQGKKYRVERSTTLAPGSWTILEDNIPGNDGLKSAIDHNVAGLSRLFYRIVVVP